MATAAAMSAMGFTSSTSRDLSKFTPYLPIQSFQQPISLSARTTGALRHSFSLKHHHNREKFPILLAFSGDGGDGIGNGNSSGGGGGDGESGGSGSGGDGNEKEALLILAEAGRSLDSIPKDLAAAIGAGKIPGSVVHRFLELEKSPFLRWLLQFGGFKERLLADDLFLTKVGIECGVGMFTKVCLEFSDDLMFLKTFEFKVQNKTLVMI